MYNNILVSAILLTQLLAQYDVGDQISLDKQDIDYNFCHPEVIENGFKLSNYNGALNGGQYKVLMIDIETSW